jgi:exosortase F-associated protein
MFQNKTNLVYLAVLVLLLILIRTFENTIFYDPFLAYYKLEYAHLPLPQVNIVKLFLSLGFRYYLNTILSLGIIYLLFKNKSYVKFSILLYMIFGSLLFISFFFVLIKFGAESKMTLFYIRRFIIQPIFLLLYIPAFYFQNKSK